MKNFEGKNQVYWNAAEEFVRLLAKFVDLKLRDDIQEYIEKNHESLSGYRRSYLEVKHAVKAFFTRTGDLDEENKLLRNASYEFQAADYLLNQGMTFEDALELLVPPLDKTKQILVKESDFEKWLDNGPEVKFKEEQVSITPRRLEKHAKANKKNLAKLLHAIRIRNKENPLEDGVDTIIAIHTEVNGMK